MKGLFHSMVLYNDYKLNFWNCLWFCLFFRSHSQLPSSWSCLHKNIWHNIFIGSSFIETYESNIFQGNSFSSIIKSLSLANWRVCCYWRSFTHIDRSSSCGYLDMLWHERKCERWWIVARKGAGKHRCAWTQPMIGIFQQYVNAKIKKNVFQEHLCSWRESQVVSFIQDPPLVPDGRSAWEKGPVRLMVGLLTGQNTIWETSQFKRGCYRF